MLERRCEWRGNRLALRLALPVAAGLSFFDGASQIALDDAEVFSLQCSESVRYVGHLAFKVGAVQAVAGDFVEQAANMGGYTFAFAGQLAMYLPLVELRPL